MKFALAFVWLTVPVASQQLTLFPAGSAAPRISGDGQVVVYQEAGVGYRWDAANGIQDFGAFLPLGASFDGSVSWTTNTGPGGANSGPGPQPFRWTQATGWTLVTFPTVDHRTSVLGVDDSGHALVTTFFYLCGSNPLNPCLQRFVRVIDETGTALGTVGLEGLPQYGDAVSRDGSTVGGHRFDLDDEGEYHSAWRVWSGGTLIADQTQAFDWAEFRTLDATGERGTVDAQTTPSGFTRAYLWERGSADLRPMEGGAALLFSHTNAMSADGRLVFGWGAAGGFARTGLVWTDPGGWIRARDYFACRGVRLSGGADVRFVLGVSADGNAAVGFLGNLTMFHVQFGPGHPFGWQPASSNPMRLCGEGSTALGDTFRAVHEGVPGGFVVTALSAATDEVPFGAGTLFIALDQLVAPLLVTPASGGTASLEIELPKEASRLGLACFLQSASPDPAARGGWNLSNGLRVIVGG